MRRLFTLAALATITACSKQVDADKPLAAADVPPADVPVALTVTDASGNTSFKTVLYSEHDAEVTARMPGVVRATLVELGDFVAAGAVLATLDDEREVAAVQSANAALDLAHAAHERAVTLHAGEMMTQAQLDSATYREKAAIATVLDTNVRLGYTRIRAPFAGRISQRMVRVGQTVREADAMFRVTDTRPLNAALRLPELQARQIRVGTDMVLTGMDGVTVHGRVARIAPTVDAASGTVEVLLNVAQPRSLTPGSAVSVDITPPSFRKASK